jgi:hypothetical protein
LAGTAFFQALRETDGRADEIELGSQLVLEKTLITAARSRSFRENLPADLVGW